jgi:hypothetical protein
VTDAITQLVLHVSGWEIRRRISPRATLNGHDFESFLGQLLRHDGARPPESDDYDVFVRESA